MGRLHPFTGLSSPSGHGRALALLLPLLAACGPDAKTPGWTFAPTEPPPPADQELIPPPPEGSDHASWELGHWHREGQQYTWVPGHYVEQSDGGSNWVDGHWIYGGKDHWIWIPGHWRKE